jgi:hypothetical protein
MRIPHLHLIGLFLLAIPATHIPATTNADMTKHETFSNYWSIHGEPVVLLGSSSEDNLFQQPQVAEELDRLHQAGGNYVRCTLSARDPGNVWPFWQDPESGLYDLSRVEGPFWERFERFLELTEAYGIVVQIEIFDRFDFAREPWMKNPFNPKNNINYTTETSGLKEVYPRHPSSLANPFFRSVPALEDNALLLRFQMAFVQRLMETTRDHGNVLYCISNETSESPRWGQFWAETIHKLARDQGDTIFVTEMWDEHNILSDEHRETWEHPEIYDFVDISQVNHQVGEEHWRQIVAFRERMAATGIQRPLNNVKIYGANTGRFGTTREAQERFWRGLMSGLATVRFHRPPAGIGASELSLQHVRAARAFVDRLEIFRCRPDALRMRERSRNEAYGTGDPGRAYGLFFPQGGQVELVVDATDAGKRATLRWLDIRQGWWLEGLPVFFSDKASLSIATPTEEGYWAAVIELQTIPAD